MNKFCIITLFKDFVLIAFIFLLLWQFSIAEELVDATTIMNAYSELTSDGYSGEILREKLKSIIDGEGEFQGHEWEEFLSRIKEMKKNPEVPENIKNFLDLSIIAGLINATQELGKIASEDFANSRLEVSKGKNSQGEYYFVIPKDIRRSKKYLKSAVEIVEQGRKLFEGHPDSEDLNKLLANQIRLIDLYDEVQESFIEYLESVNSNSNDWERYLKLYNRKGDEYSIESEKVYIYCSQKINQLTKKYNVEVHFDANSMAKDLMKLEKKYEKKY